MEVKRGKAMEKWADGDGRTDRRRNDRWTEVQTDRWVDGWTKRQTDGYTVGQMDE